ncbi:MAG: phage scaffolding protein [Pyrinomonadaceae bacterium]|nr:phage scaffolding protein [Pyrinomonadaceae bacterium]
MKRDDLKAMGIADEAIDAIMAAHGKDVESHKTAVATANAELENLKAQLTEAGTTIEGFKALKPDELKAAADEWKARAEQAQADAAKQLATVRFEHSLENALKDAKARNVRAVTALLSKDALKLNEDGSILGLKEQLETLKKESDYLFEGTQPTPKIVTGGNNQPIAEIPGLAAWKAAGFKDGPPKE